MSSTERAVLEKEAIELGFSEDIVKRSPNYTIEKMIAEHKGKHPKKSSRRTSRSRRSSRRESRKSRTEEKKELLNQTLSQLIKQDKAMDEDNDDTMTVVDMSHVTSTENPGDQKYTRFKFLVCAKNEMVKAIDINTKLKSANKDKLDADDLYVIDRDIKEAQENLKLIITEMRELHTWFQEVQAQKKVFYQKLSSRMVDISGNLAVHFQKKMENIDDYLKRLEEES
jgi:hypothetical protein